MWGVCTCVQLLIVTRIDLKDIQKKKGVVNLIASISYNKQTFCEKLLKY